MKTIAKGLSILFHPLLLPTYATLLIVLANPYWFGSFKNGIFMIAGIVMLQTFLFPVITVLLMKALNFIDDLHIRDQKQRFIPFIAIMVYYIWTFMVLRSQQFPSVILWMMLGSCIAITFAFIANILLKISLHTLGMGCLVSVAIKCILISFSNMMPILFAIIILAGVIGSVRLFLKEHEPQEIYLGYMVGFLGMMIAGWFY
jgi:hypothetical protein